jgi:hypothetical protein
MHVRQKVRDYDTTARRRENIASIPTRSNIDVAGSGTAELLKELTIEPAAFLAASR